MFRLLHKIENWIDKKNNKLDRDHQFLKTSDNKFHRWLWKLIFRRSTKKPLDIITDSALFQGFSKNKSERIIHVVNLICPDSISDKSLRKRVDLTLESIEKARDKNVILLGCASQPLFRNGWATHKLTRDAKTEFNSKRDFAFLCDMLDAANEIAKKGDIIFYSNLDCPIHPDTYKNLLSNREDATEFIRRDVPFVQSYKEIFQQPFVNYGIGVDGIAIKKEAFENFKKIFPDFIIGEPHWDTAISGILNQLCAVHQNTQDMYHIKHDQQWDDDNLSTAGQHNKRLYRAAVDYGLMPDKLISIKKGCALVLLKHRLKVDTQSLYEANLKQLTKSQGKVEPIFCEYLEGQSVFKKHINRVSYIPINPTNENVKKLNQKNSIINLLRHYFCDHKYIIIIQEGARVPDKSKIENIKNELLERNKIQTKDYIALNTVNLESRPFDFFIENKDRIPNIKKHSFINDDGLLELINTYGYFQP